MFCSSYKLPIKEGFQKFILFKYYMHRIDYLRNINIYMNNFNYLKFLRVTSVPDVLQLPTLSFANTALTLTI